MIGAHKKKPPVRRTQNAQHICTRQPASPANNNSYRMPADWVPRFIHSRNTHTHTHKIYYARYAAICKGYLNWCYIFFVHSRISSFAMKWYFGYNFRCCVCVVFMFVCVFVCVCECFALHCMHVFYCEECFFKRLSLLNVLLVEDASTTCSIHFDGRLRVFFSGCSVFFPSFVCCVVCCVCAFFLSRCYIDRSHPCGVCCVCVFVCTFRLFATSHSFTVWFVFVFVFVCARPHGPDWRLDHRASLPGCDKRSLSIYAFLAIRAYYWYLFLS